MRLKSPSQQGFVSSMRRFAALERAAEVPASSPQERCELCSSSIGERHEHLLELTTDKLVCSCSACAVLFEQSTAGHYKRVPRNIELLNSLSIDSALWAELSIPVSLAFLRFSSRDGKPRAYYPSPAGPVESLLSTSEPSALNQAWGTLGHSVLPDVEALLVDSRHASARYFRVPVDECFRLVGIFRSQWKGLSGGAEVWKEVDGFFSDLLRRACA